MNARLPTATWCPSTMPSDSLAGVFVHVGGHRQVEAGFVGGGRECRTEDVCGDLVDRRRQAQQLIALDARLE